MTHRPGAASNRSRPRAPDRPPAPSRANGSARSTPPPPGRRTARRSPSSNSASQTITRVRGRRPRGRSRTPSRISGIAVGLGRLEVGQRAEGDRRARRRPPGSARRPPRRPGKPPSGATAGGQVGRRSRRRSATTPTTARPTESTGTSAAPVAGSARLARQVAPGRGRPDPDEHEDHRVDEGVVVVVGQARDDDARLGAATVRKPAVQSSPRPSQRTAVALRGRRRAAPAPDDDRRRRAPARATAAAEARR